MKPWVYELDHASVVIAASQLEPPIVSCRRDDDCWVLEADYVYVHDAHRITLPAGFESDLASVPGPLQRLVSPFDLSIVAPLVHDFLYKHRGDPPDGRITPERDYTRRQADVLFGEIMADEGIVAWRRAGAYSAVRAFGWLPWIF